MGIISPLSKLLLVGVSSDSIADHNTLYQPLCIQACVIMAHLYSGEFAKVLTLGERKKGVGASHQNQYLTKNITQNMYNNICSNSSGVCSSVFWKSTLH